MVKTETITEKERIIEKAVTVFSRFGYQKTTTADIAKEMGKTKAYLYYYFKDKEEIFSKVIEQEAKAYIKILTSNIDLKKPLIEKIKTYVFIRIKFFKNLSERFSILKSELLSFLSLIEKIREPFHLQEIQLVYSIISEGKTNVNIDQSLQKKAEIIVNINKALEIPLFARNGVIHEEFDLNEFISLILFGLT